MVKVVEEPVQIGPGEGLSGILTRPVALDASRPAFVLLNAGLLHRVGPFRLYVQLARRLAERGFPALRLDLSGLGYTPARPGLRGVESALQDADVVFSWLESSYSLSRPVLLGSCSGADMAHRIAKADERVHGCGFLDGYAYHNSLSTLQYYSTRLHRPDLWRKWVQTRLGNAEEEDAEDEEVFWQSETPSLEQFRSDLGGFLARGLRLLYVYSGSVREYRYESQFFDVCPEARGREVTVRYYPQADHTYWRERNRIKLLDSLCDWASSAFPA
jgi:hypothetical protein